MGARLRGRRALLVLLVVGPALRAWVPAPADRIDRADREHRGHREQLRGEQAVECHRRDVLGRLIPLLAAPAWFSAEPAALADSAMDKIIAEGRRKYQEDEAKGGFIGAGKFKKLNPVYNFSDLQDYLPILLLGQRYYTSVLVQLDNPKVNTTDPETYNILRQQNRDGPVKKFKREIFKAKNWLQAQQEYAGSRGFNLVEKAHNKVVNALDQEDSQLMVLERSDNFIEPGSLRVVRRNVAQCVEALEDFLELFPAAELQVAKLVSDAQSFKVTRLPLQERYKTALPQRPDPSNATSASDAKGESSPPAAQNASAGSPESAGGTPAGK